MEQDSLELSTTAPTFAATLRAERKQKAWSQGDLSRLSHVSIRTIVDIERGKQNSPRVDVVIRLANAFGHNPLQWLKMAGHSQVSDEKIKSVISESGKFRFDEEADPSEFFGTLKDQLTKTKDSPLLLSVAYPSPSGLIHRPDIQQILVDLVCQDLWVAMVLPYPRIQNWEVASKPNLARHYSDVYSSVVTLARELLRKIPTEKRGRLGVFFPKENKTENHIRYVMPLAGLAEYRPALIKHYHRPPSAPPKFEFELGAWVTLAKEKRDLWLQVYPAPLETESDKRERYDRMLFWRDYFSEFLKRCRPFESNGWEPNDFENTEWQMAKLDPSDW